MARLARLALTDDEIERLTVELGAVLEHAADVAVARPRRRAAHRAPAAACATCCATTTCGRRSTATKCSPPAPAAEDGRFRVPRILDA